MAKFCIKCGSKLDETTGLCPKCDADKLNKMQVPKKEAKKAAKEQKKADKRAVKEQKKADKKAAKKQEKADKKAANKAKKKAKWAAMTTGQKVRRFFLKLVAMLLVLASLGAGAAGALVYFDLVDIPVVSSILTDLKVINEIEPITYTNGDKVVTPTEENICYDEDNATIYFNNLLVVYTFYDLSEGDSDELAKMVNGEVVGDISGSINVLQIMVKESTLAELELLSEKLMESESVMYAGYDYPMEPTTTEADSNPWSSDANNPDEDRGNEDDPNGNDWWAEAIGAYTAWDYSEKCQAIKVGIIDSGFSTDHPDLAGQIEFLPDYNDNTGDNHGTHVAGIIAAKNNDIGIRGIADTSSLVCVDWTPTDSVNYISTGEYIAIMKKMIENDVQVINNSWGNNFKSEIGYMTSIYWDEEGYFSEITDTCIRLREKKDESGYDSEFAFINNNMDNVKFYINQSNVSYDKFIKEVDNDSQIRLVADTSGVSEVYFIKDGYGYFREQLSVMLTGAYDSYVKSCETFSKRSGLDSVAMIIQLLLNGQEDFIIVQAAGNGYDSEGPGVDTKNSGYFCAVDEEVYNILSSSTRDKLSQKGITYSSIDNRIIIVGAVENMQDKNNDYQMTEFSCFGDNVDICAPGLNIYSTVSNNDYDWYDGTSMAAPMVTASIAHIWSLSPNLSAPEVRDILLNSTDSQAYGVGEGSSYSYPMLNVGLATEKVMGVDPDKQGSYSMDDVPDDAVEFNGHYYYIYDEGTASTYDDAQQYCEDRNGYLATVTSQKENDFLYNYMSESGFESAYFGLTDRDLEGTWEWINGESVLYTNWHSGEPNQENSNEDYAMFYYKYSDGSWNDGDFGDMTQNSGKVFICEWGEYQTGSEEEPEEESEEEPEEQSEEESDEMPVRTTSGERDIVLTLDVSGSMSGTPLTETKKAATNFIETILDEDASIGVVTYDDSAAMVSDFSVDEAGLKSVVSEINDGGSTNIEDGLLNAYEMLDSIEAKKKIIVLMSDGEPNRGKEGEELVAYADEIKDSGVIIYTLGFFENMGDSKSSAQLLMEEIASDGCHYEVSSADDLVFFFEDVADQINGQKYIYVRIACPVDISVSYNGQTLDSSEESQNLRTDFGTLTFEENEQSSSDQEDDQIKVLRLKEGSDYDIQINGTGRGTMDYTIGFMDDNGDYSDFRRFQDIRITKRTVIDTVAAVADESVLNIDEDGDGKYDMKLRAKENGFGEEVKLEIWVYAAVGGGIVLILTIAIIALRIRKKKRRR